MSYAALGVVENGADVWYCESLGGSWATPFMCVYPPGASPQAAARQSACTKTVGAQWGAGQGPGKADVCLYPEANYVPESAVVGGSSSGGGGGSGVNFTKLSTTTWLAIGAVAVGAVYVLGSGKGKQEKK